MLANAQRAGQSASKGAAAFVDCLSVLDRRAKAKNMKRYNGLLQICRSILYRQPRVFAVKLSPEIKTKH